MYTSVVAQLLILMCSQIFSSILRLLLGHSIQILFPKKYRHVANSAASLNLHFFPFYQYFAIWINYDFTLEFSGW